MAVINSLIATNTYIKQIFKTYTNCVLNLVHNFSNCLIPCEQMKSIEQPEEQPLDGKGNDDLSDFLYHNKAGLPHLEGISHVIGRPISVYDDKGNLKFTVGYGKHKTTPIKVQYHKDVQHYTLLNNKEPFAQCENQGMCLYNCISDCTKLDPNILKEFTLKVLKCGIVEVGRYAGVDLCWGGAVYTGRGSEDAARYLDNCQGERGHKFPARAHPRNHASNPSGVGVEAYSYEGRKTGFESYEDQDYVAHHALQNRKTRASMDALNGGELREVVHISGRELELPRSVQGGTWVRGSRTETFEVSTVTLVIQHFQGEYNNAEAPVFIQTMYPRYP